MSRLIDKIKANWLRGRKVVREPIRCFVDRVSSPERILQQEYRVGVEFRWYGYCLPNKLDALVENASMELREIIYGDLRSRLLRLERAVYQQEQEKAESEMRDIMREIFGR